MQLDELVRQVAVIEEVIKKASHSMRHVSPESVNTLRIRKQELENLLAVIMDSCVISNLDLEYMITKNDECIRDCFRPTYTGKPVTLPKPKWDTPPPKPPEPPLPTVPGVNLILYIDTTGSMRGDLGASGKVRRELTNFANYLASESNRANIPCTVTLVWFGDQSEDGRNSYYNIAMNKESVANLPAKISTPYWFRGGMSIPESGILALKETLAQGVKSGVANTLIYVTDAPSKENELGATPAQVKTLFDSHNINAFGIFPYKAPDIKGIFNDTRDYTKAPYNIESWADKTLRP